MQTRVSLSLFYSFPPSCYSPHRFGLPYPLKTDLPSSHPSPCQTPGRIVFEENFAFADGGTVSAYSLRGCQIANFVPPSISHFLAVPSDGTNLFRDPEALGSTTTGPSYLFFFGASTRCYKPVGNLTYLLPNCSHSLLNQT